MNYDRIYNELINKRRYYYLVGSGEKHHIVPKCMGGSNSPANLVKLTYREHFIAHRLIAKMYPSNYKLKYSLYMMTLVQSSDSRKPNSRQVAVGREALSIAAKERSKEFNPGKTEKSRKAAKNRMLNSNPITNEPWKNHTASPVKVVYTDGREEVFLCASLIPIPYGTVKYIRRYNKESKKHGIKSITKCEG